MTQRSRIPGSWPGGAGSSRRVRVSVFLPRVTVADGEWLARVLPTLQRRARPEPQAVRVEDISLRYRSGHLGIADALDATAAVLEPFAAAGANVDRRGEWYICDEDEDDEDESLFDADRPANLRGLPEQDLLVSMRVVVDADGEDGGAAALYWAVLSLANAG
jgi:hypothetical protein